VFQKNDNMGRPAEIIVLHPSYTELAHTFYTYLVQLGYSSHNCRNKWLRVKYFLHYAETHISTDIRAISTKDILNYYEHLKQQPSKRNGKPLHEKTVVDNIRMIQQLYGMLQAKDEIQINPASTINLHYPKDESPRTALTQKEIKELYSQCKTYQERAMLALAYGCGLRVSELVQCNIEDIKVREGIIVVPKGKGNKGRIVPMSKTVMKDVSNYFYKERLQQESKDPKAFIIHSKARRMQKGTYNKILKKLIERTENETIKMKQISIHNLRHSIATHLIEQGVPLERVREFLGHSQLETTEIYTHISQLQLQQLVR
jgi:integrase/recombinase XerD